MIPRRHGELRAAVDSFLTGHATTADLRLALDLADCELRADIAAPAPTGQVVVMRVPGKLPPFESLFKPGAWCTYQEVIEQYSRALYDAIAKALQ